jgi:muconolactone delta-isomerase
MPFIDALHPALCTPATPCQPHPPPACEKCRFDPDALEMLIELARRSDTSLDYLLTCTSSDGSSLHNSRLITRFRELEQFAADDQEAVIKVLDAMIMKNRMQGAMSPLDQLAK